MGIQDDGAGRLKLKNRFVKQIRFCALALYLLFLVFQAGAQAYREASLQVYDPDIKTIQLYPLGGNSGYPTLNPAVWNLSSGESMILEFDDLTASYRQFHVRLLHRNYDWTESTLRDVDFLSDFNDFIINNFEVSQSTKVKYYHYGFQLPRVRVSGNYILEVRENSVDGRQIFSKKFRVLESQVGISAQVNRPQDAQLWRTHQQVDFELNYGNYPLRDPKAELIVEIRQNFRDETIRRNYQPSSVNLASRKLIYRFFDNENLFTAGNEFRILDIRSTYAYGRNVDEVKQGLEDQVYTEIQEMRSNRTYLEAPDLNGRYLVETLEDQHPSVSADYNHVYFAVQSPKIPPHQRFCVLGEFNGYSCDTEGELFLDRASGIYVADILLKQGVYDFQLGLIEDGIIDFSFFEGDFTDTGNSYEVFVYHKPPSARSEKLIGYSLVADSRKR